MLRRWFFAHIAAGGALLRQVTARAQQRPAGAGDLPKTPTPGRPMYRDAAQPIDRRVEDLLGRMTLKEKLGQLNMPCVYERALGRDITAKRSACEKFAEGTYTEEIGPGGGFFTLANTILPDGTRQQALYFNELQKIAIEKTRLGIPLLQSEEGTHGAMCSGKTIFPEGLGIGSTWNTDLIEAIYATAAREARSVGIHQLYTLVIEPNRDPRLGRNQEGFSEDPYLCARIAEAIVRGAQGNGVAAPDKVVSGLCHFPGQSQPASGMERGAMQIPERTLREVFLPPWIAGIKKAGALGTMATYPAIDDVPTHASYYLLTKILREELGFQGLVLSEGSGFGSLVYEGVAANQKEAGQMSIKAGVDVGISYEPAYMGLLAESVQEGKASMADIDRSVRRVLRQKFVLGLFEHPYVNPERAVQATHTREHRDLAARAAREGIVLLKNDGLLPLQKTIKTIAVIGPNADDKQNQLGDYRPHSILQEIVTVLDGVKQKAPEGVNVLYAKGCDVLGTDQSGFPEAQQAAKSADVAIVVIGENGQGSKNPTNGEGYDVASLDLMGVQEDLIRAIQQTGTPTIVILINGRPLSVRWAAENVPALIEAWEPGERGGEAIADILFGDYNPSGRLSITIPRHAGQLPAYYNYMPSKRYWMERGWGKHYVDMSAEPLYHFGHGLSYTKFEYGNLRISPKAAGLESKVRVTVDVRNTGQRFGEEVVQLYLRDVLSSVTRPVKELKAFQKIPLRPAESKTVEFTLTRDDFSLFNRDKEWVVEPGAFQIMVGSSSTDIRQTGEFELS